MKDQKVTLAALSAVIITVSTILSAQWGGNYTITKSVIAGGGGRSEHKRSLGTGESERGEKAWLLHRDTNKRRL